MSSGWNFSLKPVPQVARPYETTAQKFGRKCRENPYVPIGACPFTHASCPDLQKILTLTLTPPGGALTVVNLVMAVLNLARGESLKMNYWLRGRVAMQGLTIVALLVGASRMGELDWGPDRFQRTVHWDLRQLLAQDEKAFLVRKSAAQLAEEADGRVFGRGVLARRNEVLMGVPESDASRKKGRQ